MRIEYYYVTIPPVLRIYIHNSCICVRSLHFPFHYSIPYSSPAIPAFRVRVWLSET